jgi:hypothetical protein
MSANLIYLRFLKFRNQRPITARVQINLPYSTQIGSSCREEGKGSGSSDFSFMGPELSAALVAELPADSIAPP